MSHPSVGSLGNQRSEIWTFSLNKKLSLEQGIYLKRLSEIDLPSEKELQKCRNAKDTGFPVPGLPLASGALI